MAIIPIRDRAFKQVPLKLPLRGMSCAPEQEVDAIQFDNWEVQADGVLRSRRGTSLLTTTNTLLGSQPIVGLAAGVVNSIDRLIIAKNGTTFYVINLAGPPPFSTVSTFTVPYDTLGYAVQFEFVNNCCYMVCQAWPLMVKWTGTGDATTVTGSPPYCTVIRWVPPRLYATSNNDAQSRIFFCDKYQPDSWPSANDFATATNFGKITALSRQEDKLLCFTESSLLYMDGDPAATGQFYVGVAQPDIGCTNPNSISTWGSTGLAFVFQGDVYFYSGSVALMSDAIKYALFPYKNDTGFGTLTPRYYVYRPGLVASPNQTVPGGTSEAFQYVYERLRYGSWSKWTYPPSSDVGALNPYLAIVQYVPYTINGILMAGGDGNIYWQPVWDQATLNPDLIQVTVSGDSSSGSVVPVTSTVRTKRYDFGSSSKVKELANICLYGSGQNVTLTLNLFDVDRSLTSYTLGTGLTLPFESFIENMETCPLQYFSQMQLQVSGDYMALEAIELQMRDQEITLMKCLS